MFESPPFWMYIAGFLLVLGPLITVHELGHYLVGRWFGVGADAFSIGFGKELFGWTDRRGTRWKVAAIPLGGYVQFRGDMNPASIPDPNAPATSDSFQSQSLWKRALIVFAGPATNLIVAVAIFAVFLATYGERVVENPEQSVEIGAFASGASPARDAGLLVGDRIIAVDGKPVSDFMEIQSELQPYPGKETVITALRGDVEMKFEMTVGSVASDDGFGNKGTIGQIGVAPVAAIYGRQVHGPLDAVRIATGHCWKIAKLLPTGIKQIIVGDRSLRELGGPIRIAKMSGERLSLGLTEFVYFAAFISLNLAFINLLPIPALDGGHLAFYAAEAVRKKPVGPQATEWAYRAGIATVLMLMVVVTFNDLVSLPIFGS